MEKRCNRCGETKPLCEFNLQKKGKFGRQSKCKVCTRLLYYEPRKQYLLDAVRKRRATPEGRERERTWRNEYRITNRLRRMFQEAKVRAAKTNLEFTVDFRDYSIPDTCPVLGIPICIGSRKQDGSPSIDRIDNNKGYVDGNVMIVSWRANRVKCQSSIAEIIKMAEFYKGLI